MLDVDGSIRRVPIGVLFDGLETRHFEDEFVISPGKGLITFSLISKKKTTVWIDISFALIPITHSFSPIYMYEQCDIEGIPNNKGKYGNLLFWKSLDNFPKRTK